MAEGIYGYDYANNSIAPQATSENWGQTGNPPPAASENWGQTGNTFTPQAQAPLAQLGTPPPQQSLLPPTNITSGPQHTEQSLKFLTSRLAPGLRNFADAQRYSPIGIDRSMWDRMYGASPEAQPPLAALATPQPPQPPPSYSPMPPIQGEGWYTDPNSPAAQWTGAGNIANTPQATSENWASPGNPPPATSENWGQTGMGNTGRIYS